MKPHLPNGDPSALGMCRHWQPVEGDCQACKEHEQEMAPPVPHRPLVAHVTNIRVVARAKPGDPLRFQWECSCKRYGPSVSKALSARIGARRHQQEQEKTRP